MPKKRRTWKIAISEALNWELHKETMRWALTDAAIDAQAEQEWRYSAVCVDISAKGNDFVVIIELDA